MSKNNLGADFYAYRWPNRTPEGVAVSEARDAAHKAAEARDKCAADIERRIAGIADSRETLRKYEAGTLAKLMTQERFDALQKMLPKAEADLAAAEAKLEEAEDGLIDAEIRLAETELALVRRRKAAAYVADLFPPVEEADAPNPKRIDT